MESLREESGDAVGGRNRQLDAGTSLGCRSKKEKGELRSRARDRRRAVAFHLPGQPQCSFGGFCRRPRREPGDFGPANLLECGTALGEVVLQQRIRTATIKSWLRNTNPTLYLARTSPCNTGINRRFSAKYTWKF